MVTWRLFGESHGREIGIEVRGLAPFAYDADMLRVFLSRRSRNAPRAEPDELQVEWRGKTLRITIANVDQRPDDYATMRTVPRPGHADYAAFLKTGSIPLGGGKWSGRLTAPLCAAGGIALQELARRGVSIRSRVMAKDCAGADDSFGGVVEVVAEGVPAGLGDAGGEGLESKLAAALFGIPAAKGVEFGDGFALAAMKGSEANDPFVVRDGRVTLASNHCGGILGGVSIGAPLVARVAFKPTPSIRIEQDSVDLSTMTNVRLRVRGRHDRCVAFRAAPVVEGVMALVLLGEMT